LVETVAKLEEGVLAALARGEAVSACAVQFLLRRYQTGAGADLGDAIGRALAAALAVQPSPDAIAENAARVALFVEAAALSDDDRLEAAIGALVADLRRSWDVRPVGHSAMAIGACLHAASRPAFQSTAADAIDALEGVVGRTYDPGEGVGTAADQVRTASALLTAYSLCGRLPYSMLAEELIRSPAAIMDFDVACEASRVLCRLAALHDDADYRATAVIAPGADYRRDALTILTTHTAEALRRGSAGAIYGVAALELESRG
jgi:hypothetical protein